MRPAADTLEHLGINSNETVEVLAFFSGLKQDIVEVNSERTASRNTLMGIGVDSSMGNA